MQSCHPPAAGSTPIQERCQAAPPTPSAVVLVAQPVTNRQCGVVRPNHRLSRSIDKHHEPPPFRFATCGLNPRNPATAATLPAQFGERRRTPRFTGAARSSSDQPDDLRCAASGAIASSAATPKARRTVVAQRFSPERIERFTGFCPLDSLRLGAAPFISLLPSPSSGRRTTRFTGAAPSSGGDGEAPHRGVRCNR